MKSKIKILTLMAAIFLILPAVSWGGHCVAGGTCTEDVANTKHNLALNPDVLLPASSLGATGVCVFCHTPHGATIVGSSEAPLWNRAVPLAAGFTMYNSPNTDVPPTSPLGVSLACLSCHDGTIALDALVNSAGSGYFESGNLGAVAAPGVSLGLGFDGPGVLANESLSGLIRPDSLGGFSGGRNDFVVPVAGVSGMAPFPNLTQDLTDDHPISIRMPPTDPQFDEARASAVVGNIRPIVRTGMVLPTDPRDQIRLYNTSGVGSVATDAVECASCHNPHTPRTTFLRLPSFAGGAGDGSGSPNTATTRTLNHEPNQGSLVCITCHQK